MPSRADTVHERLADDRARADADFRADHNPSLENVVELLRDHRAYWTALRRIAALHRPYGRARDGNGGWCWADNNSWPCKTHRVLEEELLP